MGKSNIIEINGKRYDARTGEALDVTVSTEHAKPATGVARAAATYHHRLSAKPARVRATATTKHVSTTKHMAATEQKQAVTTPAAKPVSQATWAHKVRVHEAVKARSQSRHQQHSTTLMRSAVTKPNESLKRHHRAWGPTDALADKPSARLQRKASAHRVDDNRLQRANQIAKSQSVSRFGRPHGPTPEPPVHLPARQPKPAEFPASHLPTTPETPVHKSQRLDDMLEDALRQAVSHLESAPAARRRRLFWRFSD